MKAFLFREMFIVLSAYVKIMEMSEIFYLIIYLKVIEKSEQTKSPKREDRRKQLKSENIWGYGSVVGC